MLAVSPSLTHSGHTSFLVLPFPSQAYSCLSASAHAVSSVWNTFPRLSPRLTPSICSGLCSDVYHRGFPRSLFKRDTAPTHDTLQYPYPVSPSLPWHLSSLVTSYLCICSWLASLHQDASSMREEMIFISTVIFPVPEIVSGLL